MENKQQPSGETSHAGASLCGNAFNGTRSLPPAASLASTLTHSEPHRNCNSHVIVCRSSFTSRHLASSSERRQYLSWCFYYYFFFKYTATLMNPSSLHPLASCVGVCFFQAGASCRTLCAIISSPVFTHRSGFPKVRGQWTALTEKGLILNLCTQICQQSLRSLSEG